MIEIKNVTKIYDGIRAVNQLNLTVRDGEIFVLLGSSGCGKSTTLNMINRLIEPTEGNIYIDGKDIKDFKPEILRRSIGYVVQGTGLFPNMTVGQNIGIVPKMLKWNSQEIKRRVKELLEMIGLDPDKYVKKYPHQLSGGEAQRIGVAVTNSTVNDTQTTEVSENEDKKSSTTGNVGDKEAAEKMIDQTVSRDEIEEKVGKWNDFELDGNGCERGVYAGKFYYDNIRINSRTYDKGETFRIVAVNEE